jgi:hypothetical protein
MRLKRLFIAYLGFPGLALAVPKDAGLTDETYIRQQFERSQEKSRETLRIREAKRKEFLDRSRVGGDGDSCLAYVIETGDCSISSAEFDRGLLSHFPDSLEFLSGENLALKAAQARQAVFEQLLDRAFLDAYRPEDSLRAPDYRNRKMRADAVGNYDGYDVPTLLKAFPDIRAQVVAASDSAWLATRMGKPRSGILPITVRAWELPDSVAALLAHFPRGEWTPIRRVPFGYLSCAWLDTLPAPGMLAKIRPRLEQPGSKSAAQARSQAIDSLRKHGEWCLDEDTLNLTLRLAPALRGQTQEAGPAWMSANSAVLPASVKNKLWTKFDHGMPDTLGPIRSVYGTWMLALSSRDIKPGKPLDSAACLARAQTKMGKEENAERIRREWEMSASKTDSDRNGEIRTDLLERLSKQGGRAESSYREMRQRWVSRSLRFTRDTGFLAASTGSGE